MKNLKFVIGAILLLVFTSCLQPDLNKRVDNERLMKALVCENDMDYNCSLSEYKKLYEETNSKIFLERYVKNLFLAKKYQELLDFTKNMRDEEIIKYRIFTFLELKKIDEAKKELLTKLNKKDKFFYRMMSYIYFQNKQYKKAAIFLKSLYALEPSKKNLLILSDALMKLEKYNEALAYLQTYVKQNGCDYEVCLKMSFIYQETYDYDNLAKIYEQMAKFNSIFTLKALSVYIEAEKYKKALQLIKKNHLSKSYELIVYEKMRDYKKIAEISKELFKKTKDDNFLLKYIYASLDFDKSKKNVLKLLPDIKKLMLKYKTASLYNLYGYLLIDYDINPKKGIKFVKKALKKEPKNWAYLDSLAWGYYKIKNCKKAYKIISKIEKEDAELEKHKKMIKECYDITKNHSKNKRKFKISKHRPIIKSR